jgi:hypothetical protein
MPRVTDVPAVETFGGIKQAIYSSRGIELQTHPLTLH